MHHFADAPLAIIGMACRLPGADNPDEFWKMLLEGRVGWGELPIERFNRELHYDPRKGVRNKSYTTLGGMIPPRPFDAAACPIPESLRDVAHQMHLNLLETAAAACRHAGLDPFNLPNRNVGVYVGHTPPCSPIGNLVVARQIEQTVRFLHEVPGFNELARGGQDDIFREIVESVRSEFPPDSKAFRMCTNAFHAPATISLGLNLSGPSMAFDAACASSMRALGHAAHALQRGQIDMALVGSASYCNSDTLILFSAAQSVSPTGSRPFDEDADGLVASEGYVTLLVKTLERAVADGDHVHAVIRGIGVSSDGKGKSLWAPRHEGQVEAIRRAYGPQVSPEDLQYIEMHATSTQVGDATEMTALNLALREHIPAGKKLPIGSVKANVGHTLESAGLASIVKTVLAMQHGVIPPQININRLNSKIPWGDVPFFVSREPLEWKRPACDQPRRAAVNSFGIGGLNVHVALDEFAPVVSRKSQVAVSAPPLTKGGSDKDEAVAIVGTGAVLPGARTVEALWDLLCSGESQIRDVPPGRWNGEIGYEPGSDQLWHVPTRMGGFITDFEYDWKKHKVPPKQVATADPLQFMLLDAADQALQNAGYRDKPIDRLRTGVIVGTIFGSEFSDQLAVGVRLPEFQQTLGNVLRRRGVPEEEIARVGKQYAEVLLKYLPALIDETGSFTASTLSSRISKTFDLMGGAVAVDAGDASGLAALGLCVDILLARDCDMMICAAGHRAMSFAIYEMLARVGHLTRTAPCGPFDPEADGYVPGEGVGVLLLKRLSDAQRDGDTIHAIIRGVGAARDDSLDKALSEAIRRAFADSSVRPEDVVAIEATAKGLPEHDRKEIAAVRQAYGSTEDVRIGALSGQFGHLGAASGVVSLLKAAAELNHAEMPQVVGLSKTPAELAGPDRPLRLAAETAPLSAHNDEGRLIAGVTTWGQQGLAYHVLLEGTTRVPPAEKPSALPRRTDFQSVREDVDRSKMDGLEIRPTKEASWKIVRLGAESWPQLIERTTHAASHAEALFADETAFTPADRIRLAIVASNPNDLSGKLQLAAKQMQNAEARPLLAEKGIFCGEVQSRPRVAFLFPGQGSQYSGMLESLVNEFPPAAEALRQVDAALTGHGLPVFAELAWQPGDELGKDVWRTQLSMLAADTVVHAAATAVGLRPERLAGHSFGELAALVAAGAWTIEDAVRATSARCRSIEQARHARGVMLMTAAPAETVETLCRETGGRVWVSHRNAPDQTVVGGDEAAVRQLDGRIRQQGFTTKILPVPAAFHTPLMEEVREPFGTALADIPLEPPRVPLLSSVTNRYVADPDDIRANLVEQMTRPVHWVGLIERLAADGMTVFVEVGPRQVLTGLSRSTLAGRPVAIVGCNHPKRSGLQQLLAARACIEVTGALDSPRDRRTDFQSVRQSAHACQSTDGLQRQDGAQETDGLKTRPTNINTEDYAGLNVLRLSGTSYEMGLQQGQAQREAIRRVLRRYADLAGTKWEAVVPLDEATARAETLFGPDELEEMRGIAKGADVAPAAVIAHNLRLYLDAGAGGLHFALTAEANPGEGLLHAVNEDLRLGLAVRDCLERNVQVRHPRAGIPHIAFGVAGQVGTLNGINARGLAVSTAALLDVQTAAKPPDARLQTVVIKEVLERAESIEEAVEILQRHRGGVPWGVCLSHAPTDQVCYVEHNGTRIKVQPSPPIVTAANHSLTIWFREDGPQPPSQSQNRLRRVKELLGNGQPKHIGPAQAQQILRDRFDRSRRRVSEHPTLNTVRRVDNQISIIMQPACGRVWVTPGPQSNGRQDEFIELKLDALLPTAAPSAEPVPSDAVSAGNPLEMADPAVQASWYAADDRQDENICRRFAMRLIDVPLNEPADRPLPLHGDVLIVGDNPAARALRERLESQGATVRMLPLTDDLDRTLAELDRLCESNLPPHLFLMSVWDSAAEPTLEAAALSGRRSREVMQPFFIVQRWFARCVAAKRLEQASLFAASVLGGDFGFSGDAGNIESGALTGLLKGVKMEAEMGHHLKYFKAKTIDAPAGTDPHKLAEFICREFAAKNKEVEVGLRNGRRYLIRPIPTPLIPGSDLATGAIVGQGKLSPPDGHLAPGAAWVVTGGARGVTAVVSRELGRRFGLKLHLIGSSPQPEIPETYHHLSPDEMKELKATVMKEALANGERPIDGWQRFEKSLEISRTLRSLNDEGVQATYHACDIADRQALAAVLERIRAADGPIRGIVHGAGFERACRFEKKQPDLVARTIATKVDGAAALIELTRQDPVGSFIAFTSISGRSGGIGQADYCTANELLAKLVDWYRRSRPGVGAVSIHWHAWDDVGMAIRPESQRIKELHRIEFMPSREGAAHLIDELLAGVPEPEIVITQLAPYRDKYGPEVSREEAANGSTEGAGVGPSHAVPKANGNGHARGASTVPARFPLIDAVPERIPGRQLTAEVHLDPLADVFLVQHRYKGRPLLPVVMGMEAMLQAAQTLAGETTRVVGLKDIEIVNGLRFHTDERQTARLRCTAGDEGIACELTADFLNRRGQLLQKDRPYLRCRVETADALPALPSLREPLPAEWGDIWYPEEDIVIYHGPAFRRVRQIAVEGDDIGWARLIAPQPGELAANRPDGRWLLPAALLDACFFSCGVYLWLKLKGVISIPFGIDRIRLGRTPRPGERCTARMHFRGREQDRGVFDFSIFGEDGESLLQLDGYRNIIVAEDTVHVAHAP